MYLTLERMSVDLLSAAAFHAPELIFLVSWILNDLQSYSRMRLDADIDGHQLVSTPALQHEVSSLCASP